MWVADQRPARGSTSLKGETFMGRKMYQAPRLRRHGMLRALTFSFHGHHRH